MSWRYLAVFILLLAGFGLFLFPFGAVALPAGEVYSVGEVETVPPRAVRSTGIQSRAAETVDPVTVVAADSHAPSIVGLVLGPDDQPVAGAVIRYGSSAAVFSDEGGNFALQASMPQTLLSVSAEGMAASAVAGIAPGAEVVVKMTAEARLRGYVLCEQTGRPVGKGWVEAKWGGVARRTTTGEDGSFMLDGLSTGQVLLLAGGMGYETHRHSGYFLTTNDNSATLRLAPAGLIRGRVVSQMTGAALVGAEVEYVPTTSLSDFVRSVHTDGSGRFEFLAAGVTGASLRVAAEGHGPLRHSLAPGDRDRDLALQLGASPSPLQVIVVEDGHPKIGVTVVSDQGGVTRRSLTDRDGQVMFDLPNTSPVKLSCHTNDASASVFWLPARGSRATLTLQHCAAVDVYTEALAHIGQPVSVECREGVRHGLIDVHGRCRFAQLPTGPVIVLLGTDRLVVAQLMLHGGDEESVKLSGEQVTRVPLQVVDPSGMPIPGARWASRQTGHARVGSSGGFVDREGRGEVALLGQCTLTVSRQGYRPGEIQIDPFAGSGAVMRVELTAEHRLSGRVTDAATQTAISEFVVTCLPGKTEYSFSSPSGVFEIDSSGVASISVRAPGWRTSSASPTADAPMNIELKRDGGIFGRVLGPGGAGLGSVTVQLRPVSSGFAPASVQTRADGSYSLAGLRPDLYRLIVAVGGEELVSTDVVVDGAESRLERTLRVAQLPCVHVMVYDEDVGPASGAAVVFESNTLNGVRRRTVSTDADGYACVRDFLPGVYVIKSRQRARAALQVVTIQLGGEEPLIELTLQATH
ncbi:MAG: hypothetical protein ACI89X_001119 [Planctomycetota bacterium]|jgi:hypothetical protein